MAEKEGWLVLGIKKEAKILCNGVKHTLPLDWAEGMIGAVAVFDTKEEAEAWANGCEIMHITYGQEEA